MFTFRTVYLCIMNGTLKKETNKFKEYSLNQTNLAFYKVFLKFLIEFDTHAKNSCVLIQCVPKLVGSISKIDLGHQNK